MKKRSGILIKKYLELMLSIDDNRDRSDFRHKWRWVTLTGFRIPVDDKFRDRIKWFGDSAEQFLRVEYEDGGFMVVEMTSHYEIKYQEELSPGSYVIETLEGPNVLEVTGQASLYTCRKEMYIHAHALVYGTFKLKTEFDIQWGRKLLEASTKNDTGFPKAEETQTPTGERFSWMETARSVPKALRYMMKYITKSIDFSDVELEALKRLKIVRTWGQLYGAKMPKYDMICEDCGARCYAVWNDEDIPPTTGELKVKLVRNYEENDGG